MPCALDGGFFRVTRPCESHFQQPCPLRSKFLAALTMSPFVTESVRSPSIPSRLTILCHSPGWTPSSNSGTPHARSLRKRIARLIFSGERTASDASSTSPVCDTRNSGRMPESMSSSETFTVTAFCSQPVTRSTDGSAASASVPALASRTWKHGVKEANLESGTVGTSHSQRRKPSPARWRGPRLNTLLPSGASSAPSMVTSLPSRRGIAIASMRHIAPASSSRW